MSSSRRLPRFNVLMQGDGSALPPRAPMKLSGGLKGALLMILVDALLRVTVLAFWRSGAEGAPDLPVFYKGVQHPLLQALQLVADITLLLAASVQRWRTPRAFAVLRSLCLAAAFAMWFLAGAFYSFNVVGASWGFAAAAAAFASAVKQRGS